MNIKGFEGLLNKSNPYFEDLLFAVARLTKQGDCILGRKGRKLCEFIRWLREDRHKFPLVDKKLGIVFGLRGSAHAYVRAELYRYHQASIDPDAPYMSSTLASDQWLYEGMGWYISWMSPDEIIVSFGYRPDSYDKDVFLFYKVTEQE